jgi:hypothetical protein
VIPALQRGGAFVVSGFAKIALLGALGSGAAVVAVNNEGQHARSQPSVAPGRERPAATSPSLQWRGVERVVILCQLTTDIVVEADVLSKALCQRVQEIARKGAPVPIDVVDRSSAALHSPRASVLFIQASIAEVAPSRFGLIFTARVERNDGLEEANTYFGARPRVAPFTIAAGSAEWDATISASLGEVLPWLSRGEAGDLLPDS